MKSEIKTVILEYRKQLCESEFNSLFVNVLFYILNFIQNLFTLSGHIRIWMYAFKQRPAFITFVSFWVILTFIFSFALNYFLKNSLLVNIFNFYRIFEIFVINLWMFLFRQGATTTYKSNKEDDIRLFVQLIVQYLTVILCFSGIYRYQIFHSPCSFNIVSMSYIESVYFSIVTITTLGFGDIYPKGMIARAIVSSEVLIGMFFVLLLFTTVLSKISFSWKDDS